MRETLQGACGKPGRVKTTVVLLVLFQGGLLAGGLTSTSVTAQIVLPVPERPGDDRRELPEYELESESEPAPILPPLPPAFPDQRLSSQLRVPVKRIKLTGNTVFSDAELAPLVAPYEGRELTSGDLQTLRRTLTLYYINQGHINSGAVIPDQQVKDGVIKIVIIEGRLTDVEVSGNTWLRDSYVRNRLSLGSDKPLNLQHLQERLQLLHQDRLIERINAELVPGLRPGEGVLRARVEESQPYELGVSFNNRNSPSVGGSRGEIWGSLLNVTGFGDSLGVRYGITKGLEDVTAIYSVPLNAQETRLRLYVDRSDADIVEEPLDFLDITSDTETYGTSLTRPLYRIPRRELVGSLIFERRRSETFSEGKPYSFSPGPHDGESNVTVLRFGLEWLDRSRDHVLAARSLFSVGIDALGATINPGDLPDGQFFAWLGQFQWVRRLGNTDRQLLLRSDLQLAADALLPLEQFAIGGATSVRGYRENLLIRDNGWVSSVEVRVPIGKLRLPWLSEQPADGLVQLAPFFDFGWGWNTDQPTPDPKTLSSIGLGIRWDPNRKIHGQLYWGIALRDVYLIGEHDLQDSGIHFAVDIQLF